MERKLLDQIKNQNRSTEKTDILDQVEWINRQKYFWMDCARNIIPEFQVNNGNRHVIADLFNYFMNIPGNLDPKKGLWLEGDIGTGKSSLMQIFSNFMKFHKVYFRIIICSYIVTQYSSIGDIDLFTYNLQSHPTGPVCMCFDELGREPIPGNHFGQKLNVMQYIFHVRYSLWQTDRLKTFVTTNLDADGIEELYGDYIRDRRKEMFNIVVLAGKSRR